MHLCAIRSTKYVLVAQARARRNNLCGNGCKGVAMSWRDTLFVWHGEGAHLWPGSSEM